MSEKMIRMKSVSGKIESFPESEVARREFYGWKKVKENRSPAGRNRRKKAEVNDARERQSE